MRISDWSSDVCSSDLHALQHHIALIRNRELGARAVQRLRNAPGKRFIVGEAHNQPALALHKTRHIFSPAVTSSTRPIASWPKSSTSTSAALRSAPITIPKDRKSTRLNSSH